MTTTYHTHGICSRQIILTIEDRMISNILFAGGCSGNLQGIAWLAGRPIKEIADKLRRIDCGGKGTFCPDQLDPAIDAALKE